MRNRLLIPILLLAVCSFLLGCQEDKLKDPNDKVLPNNTAAPKPEDHALKEVEWVKVVDPPQNVSSPSEAVVHQYEVGFKDGATEFPKKDSVIFETTLGEKSIVAIRSPEGKNNFAVFLYEHNPSSSWGVYGLVRLLGNTEFTDKEGLQLPFEKFNATKMNIPEKEVNAWVFANEKEIVTITVYKRFPFTPSSDRETILLKNGNEAYIGKDHLKNSYLYYFDTEKIIVVSGNVAKQKFIDVANSLPLVTSALFPSPNKKEQ
ncbi:hypothetical protein AB432_024785 [Brevibacillus brevis]|uniref:DUF4367 domain-containing protein n=1 Tax=Brevibacillus brevis TaxID=1393 RepID=A0A2Z4MND3_BREBE|nr:hypothetical protein [Brevibacillus brevis]AWX58055.1 hypothetical protein AB432_024785 [Brevibacillus brevis]